MSELVFESGEFEAVVNLVERVAPTRTTVLLLGESGTGKEQLAHLLHNRSPRSMRPFVPVNCSAIPESLLESELFGHEKGAFTGATGSHVGRFEMSHEGTLFIDEIGDLPLQIQVKLLRFLQDQRILPVGGRNERQLDVRIIAATHRDLSDMVKHGMFREDLFFRLNVITIKIPPLRHRRTDIRPLCEHFLQKFARKHDKKVRTLSPNVWQRLFRYDWPGNVRELENAMEQAVVLADGSFIQLHDLPAHLIDSNIPPPIYSSLAKGTTYHPPYIAPVGRERSTEPEPEQPMSPLESAIAADPPVELTGNFFDLVEIYERKLVGAALREAKGNRSEAARKLGISEKNIRDRELKWRQKYPNEPIY